MPVGHLKHGGQAIGKRFVGAEDSEIALLPIELRHIAQEHAEFVRVGSLNGSWCLHVHRVVPKVRHDQVAEQHTAVGVGIRTHASVALGRQFGQFRFQAALLVEEFLRPVAAQPVFQ